MYTQLSEWHRRHGARLGILLYPSDEFGSYVENKACMAGQYRPSGLIGRGWPKLGPA